MEYDPNNWIPTKKYKTEIIDMLNRDKDYLQQKVDDSKQQLQYLKDINGQFDMYTESSEEGEHVAKQQITQEFIKCHETWKEQCNETFHYDIAIKLINAHPDQTDKQPNRMLQSQLLLYHHQKQFLNVLFHERIQEYHLKQHQQHEKYLYYRSIIEVVQHNENISGIKETELKRISKSHADNHYSIYNQAKDMCQMYECALTMVNAFECPDQYYNI